MYTKDLPFLLQLLQTSRQSGMLIVEPPAQNEVSWQAQFHLVKGAVTSCLVRNKTDGRVVLRNDEAVRWLIGQGRLYWQIEETPPVSDAALPLLPPPEEMPGAQRHVEDLLPPGWKNQRGSIPQRTEKGRLVPVHAFASRDHRQVFALVDGRRTIEEIVSLLHKPPDAVIRVLQELQAAGFIG